MSPPLLDQTKQKKTCFVFATNEIFLYIWSLLKDLKEATFRKVLYMQYLYLKIKTKTEQDPIILKTLKIYLLI